MQVLRDSRDSRLEFLPVIPTSYRRATGRETAASRYHGRLTHLCPPLHSTFAARETQSLRQQMLNAMVGINGLIVRQCHRRTQSVTYLFRFFLEN